MSQRPLLTSLVKATQVLDTLVANREETDGLSLTEIANQLMMPVNSVHNILRTLCACGYARQIRRGSYGPGIKILELVAVDELDETQLRPRIVDQLKHFAKEQGEGYVCSILREGERHIFASVQSQQAVRINQTVLDDAPFYSKVSCRVLAAFCSESELQKLIDRQGLPGQDWPEASTLRKLHAQLKRIRREGYLMMLDQPLGVVTIACPVMTNHGEFWGVLGSYAPYFRMNKTRQRQWLEHLRKVSGQLLA